MKMKGKIISLVLIFSLITIFLPFPDNDITAIQSTQDYKMKLKDLTPSGPIIITHDDNFSLYTLPGAGSEISPYRIENLNITSTTDDTAIKIFHTTKHFVIKNCYLRTLKKGIDIFNVTQGTAQIVDNTIEGIQIDGYAIKIYSTNSTFIANNTILNPEHSPLAIYFTAIILSNAHHTYVFNNTANDVEVYSVLYFLYGSESDSLTIANNTGPNLYQGFRLRLCPNAVIVNNTITQMWAGIEIDTCPDSMIDNNYVDSTNDMTIDIFNSPSNITNNILFNGGIKTWESDHTMYRLYIVENNKINNKNYSFFVDVPDLIIDQGMYAQIFLYNCHNALIENLEFNIPTLDIYAVACNFLNIANNVFDCEIYNTYGVGDIYLRLCQNASVSHNYHHLSGDALYLDSSHNCSFSHNIVYDIGGDGVLLVNSNSTEISYNLFQDFGSGVNIDFESYRNVIHHNTFWNSPARDDCSLNIWYDINTMEGNYWSDYSGSGNYTILGSARANDTYPLGVPSVPVISEFHQNLGYSLILLLIPLIIVIPYIRKRKK